MKSLIIFLTFFYYQHSISCEINLSNTILVTRETDDIKNIDSYQNCSEKNLKDLLKTLQVVNGKIKSSQLSEILKSKNHVTKISPGSVEIIHLNKIVREKLNLPLQSEILIPYTTDLPATIFLSNSDNFELVEDSQNVSASGSLILKIFKENETYSTFNLQYQIKNLVRAYRLKRSKPAFTILSKEDVIEDYVEQITPAELFENSDNLKFFSTNKPLNEGSLIKKSDLSGINLIKAGSQIEITIENNLLRIKTSGIARRNGALGEIIDVYSPQKNKTFSGKIIDLNKIVVEL